MTLSLSRSAEVDVTVDPPFGRILRDGVVLDPADLAGLDLLQATDAKVTYVPILMQPAWAEAYPDRSGISWKNRTVFACPQLDHARFVAGDLAEKGRVVIGGLSDAAPRLARLLKAPRAEMQFLRLVGRMERRWLASVGQD